MAEVNPPIIHNNSLVVPASGSFPWSLAPSLPILTLKCWFISSRALGLRKELQRPLRFFTYVLSLYHQEYVCVHVIDVMPKIS